MYIEKKKNLAYPLCVDIVTKVDGADSIQFSIQTSVKSYIKGLVELWIVVLRTDTTIYIIFY